MYIVTIERVDDESMRGTEVYNQTFSNNFDVIGMVKHILDMPLLPVKRIRHRSPKQKDR